MTCDLALAAVLLVFGLFGLASGAIRQVAHWTGLACGALLARPAAAQITPLVAPRLGWPAAVVRVGLSGLLFGLLAALTGLAVHALLAKMAGGREDGRVNRAVGFALGAGKAGALLFAAISLLLFFEKPLSGFFGPAPKALDDSLAVGFVRRHNLFEVVHLEAAAKLEKLLQAARNPAAAKDLARDPQLQSLLNDPKIKARLQDEGLIRALESGDLSALKDDPKVAALLNDPRLAELAR